MAVYRYEVTFRREQVKTVDVYVEMDDAKRDTVDEMARSLINDVGWDTERQWRETLARREQYRPVPDVLAEDNAQ